jgi:ATP synthase protein I
MSPTSAHNGEKSPGSGSAETREVARAENHAPLAKKTRGYMQVLSLTSVGLEMGIAVVIGLLGGQWLDKRFGTEPLFLLLGVLFGCAAAGKAVWAAVKKADRMVDDPVEPTPPTTPPTTPKDVP